MKLNRTLTTAVVAVPVTILLSSCIGRFALFNKLRQWNETVGTKWTNELVFIAFWIIPVYEIAGLADLTVVNSIEFWKGTNPIACGEKVVEGNDGIYTITADATGYTVVSHNDGSTTRFTFDTDDQSWSVADIHGNKVKIMTFIDDTHVDMLTPDGSYTTIELSAQGLMAYQSICGSSTMLAIK